MKKILLFLTTLFAFTLGVQAQKITSGNLFFLFSEEELNVVIDYSKVVIDGKSETLFLQQRKNLKHDGQDWNAYWEQEVKKDLRNKFMNNFNGELSKSPLKLQGGVYPNAKYTATIYVLNIDSDGECDSEVIFTQKDSGEIVAIVSKLNGDGGKYGSFENLAGDGFQRAGTNLGKFICKQIRY